MSEFKWDDCSVRELLRKITSYDATRHWQKEIDDFKASKQPKPEWEILLIKGDESGFIYKKAGSRYYNKLHNCDIPNSPNGPHGCSIFSVKRLSDGEVFTVGEEVECIWKNILDQDLKIKFKIESFWINDNIMWARGEGIGMISNGKLSDLRHSLPEVPKELGDYSPVYLTPTQHEKLLKILNATK